MRRGLLIFSSECFTESRQLKDGIVSYLDWFVFLLHYLAKLPSFSCLLSIRHFCQKVLKSSYAYSSYNEKCRGSFLPETWWFVCFAISVLTCWLGVRKSTRPVKIEWWGVGVVICLEQGADCLRMVQLMPLHSKTPSSLASFTSGLV